MNQHLQNILSFLNQNNNLSAEEKNRIIKSLKDADKELEITAFKLDHTEKVKKTTAVLLEQTIEELEKKRKDVEAQNRELEIEASLEKVRKVAMSMMKPDDLLNICKALFNELKLLGFNELRNALINTFNDEQAFFNDYDYSDFSGGNITQIPYNAHPLIKKHLEQIRNGIDAFAETIVHESDLESWKERRRIDGEPDDPRLENISALYYYFYSIGIGAIGISAYKKISDEQLAILKCFRNVFDLAYKRYVDITNAEAQAREAKIEAALEKVRSRSLAVHKTDEFNEVIKVVFKRLQELEIPMASASINVIIEGSKDTEAYICGSGEDGLVVSHIRLIYFDHPIANDRHDAYEKGLDFFTKTYSAEEKNSFYEYEFEVSDLKYIPADIKKMVMESQRYTCSVAFTKNSMIVVNDFEGKSLSLKQIDIVKRFARVFEQAYIRFLDLQKAEANAREAQIEAALEKVRSRSLAMHHSNELEQVVASLFDRLVELGLSFDGVGIFLFEKQKRNIQLWVASIHQSAPLSIDLPYDKEIENNAIYKVLWNAMEKGEHIHNRSYSGATKNDYFRYVWKYNDAKIPESIRQIHIQSDSWTVSYAVERNSIIGFDSWSRHLTSDEDFQILIRFAKVFEQAYTRFLDLQKAEAQAREAQIEAALERVRSRTMGMQKSEELKEIIQVVYGQLVHLNILVEHAGFIMDYKERDDMNIWLADKHEVPFQVTIPYFDCAHWNSFIEAKEKGINFFTNHLSFEEKNKFYQDLFKLIPGVPEETLEYYFTCPGLAISTVLLDNVGLYIENFSGIPYSDEENKTLMRFGKVFQQTYTRFLDLQKAEAQAREAEIELGLEKVRSRAMAMRTSEELNALIGTVFTELTKLDIVLTRCVILIYEGNEKGVRWWMANSETPSTPMNFFVKYADMPFFNEYLKGWYNRSLKWQYCLEDENKIKTDGFLFNETELSLLPDFVIEGMKAPDRVYLNASFNNFGNLTLATLQPLSEEHFNILLRFAKVFDLTYTRFNDLKQAEAQAREAAIELALERVRARTMAMQKSEELSETAYILFQQFKELGDIPIQITIGIFNEEKGVIEFRITGFDGSGSKIEQAYNMDIHEPVLLDKLYTAWKQQKKSVVVELTGKAMRGWVAYRSKISGVAEPVSNISDDERRFVGVGFFSKGMISFSKREQISEETIKILERFTRVFDLTYTRFLDLQRAEAQAREAQIELSLERVRAKTMAMHNSNDVADTVATLFDEVVKLGIETIRCGIGIMHEDNQMEVWTAKSNEGGKVDLIVGRLNMMIHPLLKGAYNSWRNKNEFYTYELSDDDLVTYFTAMNDYPDYPVKYDISSLPRRIIHSEFHFAEGSLFVFSLDVLSAETKKIFKRFANVFGQTYRRYLDLQKAEAQAKEAQIEAALERVRSRTLAMQKSDELAETSAVLFNQLISLGISPNRLYISIMKDDAGETEFWITDEDGSKVSMAYEDNLNNNPSFKKMYDGWKQQKKSWVIDMKGEELKEYLNYLNSIHVPFKGELTQKRRWQYIAYFSKGFIGMASPDEQPAETLQLLERFAYVFNLTFTRFNDLQIAEAHALQAERDLIEIKAARKKAEETLVELQSTQKQLIQTEKMASLGELTAGIAHEIQNPLNFVNNFSEVNEELLIELVEEFDKGNAEEAKAIANDIKQNLEKINHHGKRADAIVKGMLQHSRKNTGEKEPTDINALCDEYLRLSYHGLRAKDKSFNADFKTEFDQTIGKINIIPQDIGRVLLNLFNNAFYAVNEKLTANRSPLTDNYKPTVLVQTKKLNDKVEIIVSDNGNGIPQNIIDKIFQPFFTTKPTGEGTGLGLSLSYDIIKAHGGEIKVQTKEGEGSEFIILLPLS